MPTYKSVHPFKATSVSVRVSKKNPKSASVICCLSNGDFLTVAIPRYLLKRVHAQIDRAEREVPLPSRQRSTGP
jgi:hypothetical protein